MALIEEYHVTADMYNVNPDTNPNIIEGMAVTLDSNGFAVAASNTSAFLVGVAGDSTTEATNEGEKNTHYQSELVINAAGSTRNTGNRVSDLFNDTLASAKLTVYNNGGKFHTDMFETLSSVDVALTYAVGDVLYPSDTGRLTKENIGNNAKAIGVCVVAPREYPSGVPGVDTPDGSISLGSFLTFRLTV